MTPTRRPRDERLWPAHRAFVCPIEQSRNGQKILTSSMDLHGSSQIGIEPPNNRNLRVFLRVSFRFLQNLIDGFNTLIVEFDSVPGTIALVRPALACWVGYALIALWMTSGASAGFDDAGMRLWREAGGAPLGPDWLTAAFLIITDSGDGWVRYGLALLAAGAALAAQRGRLAAAVALAAFTAPLFNRAMKLAFARPRPDLVPHLTGGGGNAFPSGHSFNAAAAYLAAALALGALTGRTRPLLALALAWSALVAFSRVWLGVHWPTDALAGWLGGLGWTLAVFAALER
jgi:undecaprenyl-diphosphatase